MRNVARAIVPDGYKQSTVGVIPLEWSVALMRDVSDKITDGTHYTPKPVGVGFPFLTAIHVKENKINFEGCYYLPKDVHQEIYRRCNPEKNDVLMVNIGAGVATSALVNVDYEFSLKNVALIKPNQSKLFGPYLNYYQSYVKSKVFESLSSGGAQPFLSLTQIGQLKISLPPVEEQKTIANALSDVDALITSLEKLIAKKRAIKTAAMQQLLTGNKRLPPFDKIHTGYKQTELGEIPEDWDVERLGAITTFIGSGKTNTKGNGDIPLYGSTGQIGTCKIYEYEGPSILIARVGANAGRLNFVDGFYGVSDNTIIIKFGASSNEHFYKYQLIRMNLNSLVFGSGQPLLTGSQLKRLFVPVPKLEEQTAIERVLSDIDLEIEKLEKRVSKTKQLKQGMMQELLTGRTRLV